MTTFAYAARPRGMRAWRRRDRRTAAVFIPDYIPAGTADLWKNARRTFDR